MWGQQVHFTPYVSFEKKKKKGSSGNFYAFTIRPAGVGIPSFVTLMGNSISLPWLGNQQVGAIRKQEVGERTGSPGCACSFEDLLCWADEAQQGFTVK